MVGSLRKGSFNAAIARSLPALALEGATISTLPSVGEFPHYDGDIQTDGVIIVTPEHSHTILGVLKNAIDWISLLPNQPFAAKPVALESASQGLWGGLRAQRALRQMFVYLGGRVLQ